MPELVSRQTGRCHVNRKLLPIKGFYFFFLAAVGSLLPFIAIYMKSLGLTSSETGVLYGVMPFVGFFTRPFIGALADMWRKHKVTLMLCSVLTGLLYLLILTIPARKHHALIVHSQLDCNVQDSYFKDCVVPSDENTDSSTCDLGLSEFADRLSNSSSSNRTDFDCDVHCTESEEEEGSEGVGMCFTDDVEAFVKRCKGKLVTEVPVQFKLLNFSHVLNSEVVSDRTQQLHCRDYDLKSLQHGSQQFWQLLCDKEDRFKCQMTCRNPPKQLCQSSYHEFDSTFGWLFLVYLLANLAFSPVFSLADAATFDTLGKEHYKFGQQRLWGTVGFAVFAITSTFIMYLMTKQGSAVDYTVPFYIFVTLCCLASGAAYFMNLSSNINCGNMFEHFFALMSIPQVIVFLLVVTYFGITTGAIEGFLFWYLTDLGATTPVFGFSLVVNCLFEVPLLFVSGTIIKRVGAVPCLYVALTAVALRFLGYSCISNPWLVLLIEPLHGITFGIMWAASSTNAAMIAPPGMSATIQGLLGGIHFGIGKGVGSLLTGFMFARVGERWSFRIYAATSVVVLALYVVLNYVTSRCYRRSLPSAQQNQNNPDHNDSVRQNDLPLLSPSETSFDRIDDNPRSTENPTT